MEGLINAISPLIEAIGLNIFFEENKRVYYPFLLSALSIAVLYYIFIKPNKNKPPLLQYLFPKRIWLHQSSLVDIQLFIFNSLLRFFLIAPYLIAHGSFAFVVVRLWEQAIGIQDTVYWSNTIINILYTIVFIIVSDFSRFILHYCLHKIPFLWHFHKVHHAAEVLTPITLYRVHPLEFLLFKLRSVLVFGLVAGSFYFWFRTQISPIQILGIHAAIFFFNLAGANLRHSHIPFGFGKYLEHLFISPAQHQIHHGSHPKYFDKNFGSLFALWDWIFGSLVISQKEEKINFGIDSKEQKRFKRFTQNLFSPIIIIWKRFF